MTDDAKRQLNNLMCAVADGDAESLDGIYVIAAKRMYVAALTIVGERAAAEDVVSDSFIKVARFAKKYKTQTDALGWLLKIVRNTALDYLRKRKRRAEVSAECLFNLADENASPEKCERAAMLEQAIAKLDDGERRAIYMRYYLDMTVREIAQAIGVPRSSTERLLLRAENNLKKFLQSGIKD